MPPRKKLTAAVHAVTGYDAPASPARSPCPTSPDTRRGPPPPGRLRTRTARWRALEVIAHPLSSSAITGAAGSTPRSAASCGPMRAGHVSQASRSIRAKLNALWTATSRAISVPRRRSSSSCARRDSMTVLAARAPLKREGIEGFARPRAGRGVRHVMPRRRRPAWPGALGRLGVDSAVRQRHEPPPGNRLSHRLVRHSARPREGCAARAPCVPGCTPGPPAWLPWLPRGLPTRSEFFAGRRLVGTGAAGRTRPRSPDEGSPCGPLLGRAAVCRRDVERRRQGN